LDKIQWDFVFPLEEWLTGIKDCRRQQHNSTQSEIISLQLVSQMDEYLEVAPGMAFGRSTGMVYH